MSSPKKAKHTSRALGWPEALCRWETHLRAEGRSPLTVRGYLFEARRLRDYLEGRRVRAPREIGLAHLRDYQVGLLTGNAARSGRSNGNATVHRIVTTLRSFFAFLVLEGALERDPSLGLQPPRATKPLPGHTLTPDQVRRLLAAPDLTTPKGLRDRALLEVLYATGLRRGEALALDLDDLDHHEREVRVRHGKGDKGRVLPVVPSAWRRLTEYVERGRPALTTAHPDSARSVFLSPLGRRMSESTILRALRQHAAAAGLARLSPHTLRRTFATQLHERGTSLRVIQDLLGHASLDTTMVYLRVDSKAIRREVIRHHPREGLDA